MTASAAAAVPMGGRAAYADRLNIYVPIGQKYTPKDGSATHFEKFSEGLLLQLGSSPKATLRRSISADSVSKDGDSSPRIKHLAAVRTLSDTANASSKRSSASESPDSLKPVFALGKGGGSPDSVKSVFASFSKEFDDFDDYDD